METIHEMPDMSDEYPAPHITDPFALKILSMLVRRWVWELDAKSVKVSINGRLYVFSDAPYADDEVVTVIHVTYGIWLTVSMHIDPAATMAPAIDRVVCGDICSIDLEEPSSIWINGVKTEI
jgi:hypothetical protein